MSGFGQIGTSLRDGSGFGSAAPPSDNCFYLRGNKRGNSTRRRFFAFLLLKEAVSPAVSVSWRPQDRSEALPQQRRALNPAALLSAGGPRGPQSGPLQPEGSLITSCWILLPQSKRRRKVHSSKLLALNPEAEMKALVGFHLHRFSVLAAALTNRSKRHLWLP